MKFTKLRKNGQKLNSVELEQLVNNLVSLLESHGYITDGKVINSQQIKLGLHSKPFVIDINKHGYNTSLAFGRKKRIRLPAWDQRVHYNDLINDYLNENNITTKVTSGPFTIRNINLIYQEHNWLDQKPDYMWHNENRGFRIEKGDYKKDYKND